MQNEKRQRNSKDNHRNGKRYQSAVNVEFGGHPIIALKDVQSHDVRHLETIRPGGFSRCTPYANQRTTTLRRCHFN
jgi:hypothetical protein